MNDADVKMCRDMAAFYRARGFNPLPSRPDAKRPMLKYAGLWESQLDAASFDLFRTTNVQVMTGRRWGLLVIDLDGPEAVERWASMGRHADTWVSRSGGGGRHVWFSVREQGRPLPKAVLWKGEGEHSAIERLCDRSLIMAPPSIHPKTGRRYTWIDRRHSPKSIPLPALCPAWVLQLAPVRCAPDAWSPPDVQTLPRGRASGPWRETIESIPDIPSLVRSWGLRTVGSPRQSGWLSCHAFDRDDANPSAAIHARSGYYLDSGSGLRMGLLDLAVAMHVYPTAQDAIDDLGGRYGRCG